MANLDLLWSEGAAYSLTFAGALQCWRPFVKTGGIAVILELSWFDDVCPVEAGDFLGKAYPEMSSVADNSKTASSRGYKVEFIQRLATPGRGGRATTRRYWIVPRPCLTGHRQS